MSQNRVYHNHHSPLPVYWPYGRRFRGLRIDLLPENYLHWALQTMRLPAPLKAALRAEDGLRQLAFDQGEGY